LDTNIEILVSVTSIESKRALSHVKDARELAVDKYIPDQFILKAKSSYEAILGGNGVSFLDPLKATNNWLKLLFLLFGPAFALLPRRREVRASRKLYSKVEDMVFEYDLSGATLYRILAEEPRNSRLDRDTTQLAGHGVRRPSAEASALQDRPPPRSNRTNNWRENTTYLASNVVGGPSTETIDLQHCTPTWSTRTSNQSEDSLDPLLDPRSGEDRKIIMSGKILDGIQGLPAHE
jgi:hypothetical protein